MSVSIPPELIEQLQTGNVVLFCGAGKSASEGGLPGRSNLPKSWPNKLKNPNWPTLRCPRWPKLMSWRRDTTVSFSTSPVALMIRAIPLYAFTTYSLPCLLPRSSLQTGTICWRPPEPSR